ncbi:peptide ABC transporter, permease protein [Lactobacillus iners LactinV 09V1-c]|nr:peptide ABC transporter, permease protein [Lactobacillus iners LactinV 09V1-c]
MFSKKKKADVQATDNNSTPDLPPSAIKVVAREIVKDKISLLAFLVIALIFATTFIGSFAFSILHVDVTDTNIADAFYSWGQMGHILGTDDGGRDILNLLIVGGRNSIMIGLSVTFITEVIGLVVGVISGYYGGFIDAIIMRIIDFIQILPQLPIIIVLVSVIPNYNSVILVALISLLVGLELLGIIEVLFYLKVVVNMSLLLKLQVQVIGRLCFVKFCLILAQ